MASATKARQILTRGTSMNFAVSPPRQPTVPVAGGGSSTRSGSGHDAVFPVRRVYCVAKNYSDHVREMGGDPDRDSPCFFTKPADAVVPCDKSLSSKINIPYPLATTNLHHEIELAIAIGKSGSEITEKEALNYVFGYAAAVDLTRRDLQAVAKQRGLPWDCSKAFDKSAPISNIYPANTVTINGIHDSEKIWLDVNGEQRQSGTLNQMIWSVPEIIAILSQQFCLEPGDLILCGTPSGVGPIEKGDLITGGIDGIGGLAFTIS